MRKLPSITFDEVENIHTSAYTIHFSKRPNENAQKNVRFVSDYDLERFYLNIFIKKIGRDLGEVSKKNFDATMPNLFGVLLSMTRRKFWHRNFWKPETI